MAAESGSGSGGTAARFGASVGAVPGSVKMTYVGKDKYGNPMYRFTYKVPGGRVQGGTITQTRTMAIVNGGFVAPNSVRANPNQIPEEAGPGEGPTQGSETRDRFIARVGELAAAGHLTSDQARQILSNATNWSDQAMANWMGLMSRMDEVPPPSVYEDTPEGSAEGALGDLYIPGLGGGGGGGYGGGGGGGGAGPVAPAYRAPDERVVTDFVKGTLVSMVGTIPEELVGPGVAKYMADHRAMFDAEVKASMDQSAGLPPKDYKEIDPQQSVLEYVRSTREYQIIHKNRPKSADERTWISDRQEQALQGGLSTSRQENFAITQATAGGDVKDVAEAAGVAEFKATGQMPTFLDNQVRNAITGMMSRVGR
jgi:hypothetical protein